MIIIFGPAGSGKSVQGQILAARQGWRWLSSGQLLRDSHDPELLQTMQSGVLVAPDKVNKIVGEALIRAVDIDKVVLDGFPRMIEQAHWLVENRSFHGRSISLVVVLEVTPEEISKRLKLRGRIDDNIEAIDERLKIYGQEINPILDYFKEQSINIVHINGIGSVGQVHDRIMEEVEKCKVA